MRPKLGLLLLTLSLAIPTWTTSRAAEFDHTPWQELLQRYVSESGRVSYRSLQETDRSKLDDYLEAIATASLSGANRQEKLAFYINAYNATVFKAVLSGQSAESLIGRARMFRFGSHEIAGREISLEDLENEVIRKEFGDARIHFALVCASTSCPPLAREAYTAKNLDALLDSRGRLFLADRMRNPLGSGSKLVVSQIFKWFAEDFEKDSGSVQKFIAKWVGGSAPACLLGGSCRLSFASYDWSMNAAPGQRP